MLPITTALVPTVSRFLNDDWNNLFDWSNRPISHQTSTLPPVNFQDSSDSIIIQMAIPGLDKSNFEVQLNDQLLTIKVEASESKQSDNYILREFNYHSFTRSFSFDENELETENIEATYNRGMLTLMLPKKEKSQVQPNKIIEIK